MNLKALEARGHCHSMTGIMVRALGPDGLWGTYDIAELERESLKFWLGHEPDLAVRTVFQLLGYDPVEGRR